MVEVGVGVGVSVGVGVGVGVKELYSCDWGIISLAMVFELQDN